MSLWSERRAGALLHITSLPGDYGVGSIGVDARRFVDALCAMGLTAWQFLPLGPTAYGDSPYQPLSTFAGNELLIDVADLLGDGLVQDAEVSALRALPSTETDYSALIPAKRAVLATVAEAFDQRATPELQRRLAAFVSAPEQHWLSDYALFRVLKREFGEQCWLDWPASFRQRDAVCLADFAGQHQAAIRAEEVLQFLFHDQWQRLVAYANKQGVLLLGDVPIYLALDSADAWANRELLEVDDDGRPQNVAGVPPDYFSEDGQLWGNPLYNWAYHADTGFSWWIARLRAAASRAACVRLDHFRGLESYWSVPSGASSARDGQWLSGPGDAFFFAVKQALPNLALVAEDLGLITPEVEQLRDRHALPGMVVLQFKIDDDGFDPTHVPSYCVCYTGTHDNDTTHGWFHGAPGDTRSAEDIRSTQHAALALTGGSADTIARDVVHMALASDACLCIVPMQDFLELGSFARFNTPGESGANWRWRLEKDQIDAAFCATIKSQVNQANR
ncbi:MAG: 4-alpha-glucanotransferase [Pseudomonadota bacterium]